MEIRCDRCHSKYHLDDALIKPRGTAVKCARCGHRFKVFPASDDDRGVVWVVTTSKQRLLCSTQQELRETLAAAKVRLEDLVSIERFRASPSDDDYGAPSAANYPSRASAPVRSGRPQAHYRAPGAAGTNAIGSPGPAVGSRGGAGGRGPATPGARAFPPRDTKRPEPSISARTRGEPEPFFRRSTPPGGFRADLIDPSRTSPLPSSVPELRRNTPPGGFGTGLAREAAGQATASPEPPVARPIPSAQSAEAANPPAIQSGSKITAIGGFLSYGPSPSVGAAPPAAPAPSSQPATGASKAVQVPPGPAAGGLVEGIGGGAPFGPAGSPQPSSRPKPTPYGGFSAFSSGGTETPEPSHRSPVAGPALGDAGPLLPSSSEPIGKPPSPGATHGAEAPSASPSPEVSGFSDEHESIQTFFRDYPDGAHGSPLPGDPAAAPPASASDGMSSGGGELGLRSILESLEPGDLAQPEPRTQARYRWLVAVVTAGCIILLVGALGTRSLLASRTNLADAAFAPDSSQAAPLPAAAEGVGPDGTAQKQTSESPLPGAQTSDRDPDHGPVVTPSEAEAGEEGQGRHARSSARGPGRVPVSGGPDPAAAGQLSTLQDSADYLWMKGERAAAVGLYRRLLRLAPPGSSYQSYAGMRIAEYDGEPTSASPVPESSSVADSSPAPGGSAAPEPAAPEPAAPEPTPSSSSAPEAAPEPPESTSPPPTPHPDEPIELF